jgi:hypothetical protein
MCAFRASTESTSIRTFRADLERLGCSTALMAPTYPSLWEEIGEFSAAVVRVLRDPDLQRVMGREGRAYVAERWSSAAMAARLVEVYEAPGTPEAELATSARP